MSDRRAHRRNRVADSFGRLLLADPADVLWLTGLSTRAGPRYLWLEDGEWSLILPEEAVADAPAGFQLHPYLGYDLRDPESGGERAAALLAGLVSGREYASASGLPLELVDRVGRPARIADAELARVRAVKDPDELELIRHGVRMLDSGLRAAARVVEPGRREAEVWAALVAELVAAVGDDVAPAGNLGSGERSLEADPRASQRVLGDGDAVLLDAYPSIGGYGADLTRTWLCGEPSEQLIEAHQAVESTLHAVGSRLRPGLAGGEVDSMAHELLAEAAPGAHYGHHTGHGFGVRQWEGPWLVPDSTDVLEPGMVVAVEPGWYLPECGGVRLEQDYVIVDGGAEPLSEVSFSWRPA
jgi:Xaa-Pro dipeptidase